MFLFRVKLFCISFYGRKQQKLMLYLQAPVCLSGCYRVSVSLKEEKRLFFLYVLCSFFFFVFGFLFVRDRFLSNRESSLVYA